MNTKLNQAILKVARTNPEFRKALKAEIQKQAEAEDTFALLQRQLLNARGHLKFLDKIVKKDLAHIDPRTFAWYFMNSEDRKDNWDKFKDSMEKANTSLALANQSMAKAEAETKKRWAQYKRNNARMARLGKELVKYAPPGVKAQYKNPNGVLDFDYTTDTGNRGSFSVEFEYNDYTGTNYDAVAVFPRFRSWFIVKLDQKNPAKAIWDELVIRGIL